MAPWGVLLRLGLLPGGDSSPRGLLTQAFELSGAWLDSLPDRHVGPVADAAALRSALDAGLTDDGVAPDVVLSELASAVDPGLAATPGPRYFGFVTGGALPVALAAD